MSKHTKGPWTYDRNGDYFDIRPILLDMKDNMEGNEADYRLIAAAPDLLKACKAALDSAQAISPEQTAAFKLCRAAIHKATRQKP